MNAISPLAFLVGGISLGAFWLGYDLAGKKVETKILGGSEGRLATSDRPPALSVKPSQVEDVIAKLAADPQALAGTKLEEYPEATRNHPSFRNLIFAWLTTDPEKASYWLSFQSSPWVSQFLRDFGQSVAQRLPKAGIDFLLALKSPGKYPEFEAVLITQLPYIPGGFEQALKSDGPFPPQKRNEIIKLWAESDGGAALKHLRGVEIKKTELQKLLTAAVTTSPGDAIALAQEADPLGNDLLIGVLAKLANAHPSTLMQWMATYPDHPATGRAAVELWEAEIQAGTKRTIALESIPAEWQPYAKAVETLDISAEETANLISSKITAGERDVTKEKWQDLAFKTAKSYGEQDPEAALAWADALPGPLRQRALTSAAEAGAAINPPAVSEWLNGVQPSPERDGVIFNLVRQIPDDPHAALQWSSRIYSPALRGEAQAFALAKWNSLFPGSIPSRNSLHQTTSPIK